MPDEPHAVHSTSSSSSENGEDEQDEQNKAQMDGLREEGIGGADQEGVEEAKVDEEDGVPASLHCPLLLSCSPSHPCPPHPLQ